MASSMAGKISAPFSRLATRLPPRIGGPSSVPISRLNWGLSAAWRCSSLRSTRFSPPMKLSAKTVTHAATSAPMTAASHILFLFRAREAPRLSVRSRPSCRDRGSLVPGGLPAFRPGLALALGLDHLALLGLAVGLGFTRKLLGVVFVRKTLGVFLVAAARYVVALTLDARILRGLTVPRVLFVRLRHVEAVLRRRGRRRLRCRAGVRRRPS